MSEPIPLPPFVDWFIFPFEGELRVRDRLAPNPTEHVRDGDPGGPPCQACARPDSDYLWAGENWRVVAGKRKGVLQVFLETRAHLDFEDLTPELAAELGPMQLRIHRAMQAAAPLGRVLQLRSGDGSAHYHLWFYGRPFGDLQLAGFCMPMWAEMLPPMPQAEWDACMAAIAADLAATA